MLSIEPAARLRRTDVIAGKIPSAIDGQAMPPLPKVNWSRKADVVLCSAPLASVVRPSLAVGLLQSAVQAEGATALSLYLNIFFAELIGVDLNEFLAERTPSQLLVGDWLFSGSLGSRGVSKHDPAYADELTRTLGTELYSRLRTIRDEIVPVFLDEFANRIVDLRPCVVGFSSVFQQQAASLAFAIRIKHINPKINICFGGANCHGPMGAGWKASFPEIDYLFTGEADVSFPTVVRALIRDEAVPTLKGVIGPGQAGSDGSPTFVAMNKLPYPNFEDFLAQLPQLSESGRVRVAIPFESSRGCWWGQKRHCTFCGLNGESLTFREKSPARVLAEIDHLREKYGIFRFLATDDIMSMGHVEQVFGSLATRDPEAPGNAFFYEVKANIGEEQLRTLAAAGVTFMQPGIESFSDQVLGIMRKGVSGLLNLRFLRNCSEIGIATAWSILFGFPGEAIESYHEMADLVRLIEHLQPPMGLGAIRMDRFSPNFEQWETMGFEEPRPFPAYSALYNLDAETLQKVAYFFTAQSSGIEARKLERLDAEIRRWQSLWFDYDARPVLQVLRGDGMDLIHDTRSCAAETLAPISKAALSILDASRDPISEESLIEKQDQTRMEAARTISALKDSKYLVSSGKKVMSLVTDASRRVLAYDVRATLPYGFISAV